MTEMTLCCILYEQIVQRLSFSKEAVKQWSICRLKVILLFNVIIIFCCLMLVALKQSKHPSGDTEIDL